MAKLREALYTRDLLDEIRDMKTYIASLRECIEARENRIKTLEETVRVLEQSLDNNEQYGRRANLRIQGLPETVSENTDAKVIEMIKNKMAMNPLQLRDTERSHRLGRKGDADRPRPLIIRFATERVLDSVYRVNGC